MYLSTIADDTTAVVKDQHQYAVRPDDGKLGLLVFAIALLLVARTPARFRSPSFALAAPRPLTLQEVCPHGTSHRFRQQCLSRPWRSIQQYSLWWFYPHSHEQFRILQWQFNDLSQLPNLIAQSSYSCKRNVSRIFDRHVVD